MPNLGEWERVLMFRCVQDPMIGPKPKNAFMLPDLPDWEAWLHVASGTIHVKVPTQNGPRRHVVSMGNWASIELYKEDVALKTQTPKRKTSEKAEESVQ